MAKRTAFLGMLIALAWGGSGPARAAQYFSNAGGAQPWDAATANWSAASGGPYDTPWGGGDAIFEGTAGTVTVSTVSADSLTFGVAGYTLAGGTVTLAGPSVAADSGATILSALTGTKGLAKVGTGGTLTLGGTNTFTGGLTVSAGTVAASQDSQLGAAGEGITLAGGTLRVSGTLNTITRPLALGAGGGTFSLATYLNYNGAITGGTSLASSGSDIILAPPAPNSIGTFTLTGSRLFVNNANAIANNAVLVIAGGGKLAFQGGSAPTAPTNTITFASGCGVCMRSSVPGDLTLSTTNATFPAAGSFGFNNDDQGTRGVTVVGAWPALTGALNLQVGGGTGTPVGAATLNAALSGSGALTKANPGTLVLAASNSFTGGLTVEGGTLRLGHFNGAGAASGLLTVKNGAAFDLAGFSPRITGLSDTLGFGALGTAAVTNSGAAATLTITRANQAFGGAIGGPVSLVIPAGGSSYQILSGNSTYTGVTTVYGSLESWNTNALGATSAGTVVTNGAALALKGTQDPMTFAAEPLTFYGAASFSLNTDSALRNAIWTGPVTLAPGAVVTVSRGGANAGTFTIQAPITGGGAINKDNGTGAFPLILAGTNDYSGGTTLTAGTIKLGSDSGLGTGPVAVNAGLLDLNGFSPAVGSLSGAAAGAIVDTSAGAGTVTLTVNQTANTTCSSPISNGLAKTVAFVKTGSGILTLNATNTFAGAFTVSGGTLKLGLLAALPTAQNSVAVTSGGTLDVNALSLNNGARTVTIAGPGAAGQSGALANTGNAAEAQVYNLTLSDDATVGTTGSKLNVYGTLNGGGKTLTVAGSGEINLRVSNGLQNLAAVTVNSGLLRLESSQSWAGTYTVNAAGKLDSYGLRTESGNVVLNGGRLGNGGGGIGTWTGAVYLTATSVVDTASTNMVLSNTVSGPGALNKIGTGQLTLAGACSFAGALAVSNGTVTLNGSLAHANVSVAAGATLNGSGTLHARIADGTPDTLRVLGTANLSGLALDLDVSGWLYGKGPFTLVDATGGTLAGRFASVRDVPAGYAVSYQGQKVMLVSSGTLIRIQ